jgi:hypothetical protein
MMIKRCLVLAGICTALSACGGMGSDLGFSGSSGSSEASSMGSGSSGGMADSQRPEDQTGMWYDPADTVHSSDTRIDNHRGGYSGTLSDGGS